MLKNELFGIEALLKYLDAHYVTIIPTESCAFGFAYEAYLRDGGISPDQQRSLRRNALVIKRQLAELKSIPALIGGEYTIGYRQLLGKKLSTALDALRGCEGEVTDLQGQRSRDLEGKNDRIKVFFADLYLNYAKAAEVLEQTQRSLSNGPSTRGFLKVNSSMPHLEEAVPPLQASTYALEESVLAIDTVLLNGSLDFDLKVDTLPHGAVISYRRRGEQFQISPEPTRSTITSLTFAIWTVHTHLSGFVDKEVTHDPFREQNHEVVIVLEKKAKADE